ncbi:sensor histidine kinase [Paenibacillus sp. P2(2022)]|uniref:sensor histidine kinase n=1 Tax=Paenibacillus TaxID=44249 RepID=UPI0005ECC967|nr:MULTISPECIES: sensor histidine kinase [Paenibacillus]MEB4782200.1 sensor histidine kinase [Paenibacillus jamilae]AUS29302.1 histidine kinase [Paenibacillus polymyxa]KJK30317.1 histidine kinase [Paenibacillus polymyxa]MDG0054837.1 sensor histidine kinase [Paenibacillus sp. P2(2022)]WOZ38424.1 sensor histidine kinase [Paenibacillus polymyxa]
MIKKYLTERRSWILLFVCQQMLILLIAYVDTAIPLMPILYVVFLSMLVFLVFLIVRYPKETKFYRALEEWEGPLQLTGMGEPESPFERIIEHKIVHQTERLQQMISQNQLTLEHEKDELLSWIHEVKTPLTAMHLMIERLDDKSLKAQLTYEWLRIHLLLDQQLHQKRISFIENDLYVEQVDLKSLVFKEIKALQSWCIQKGIGFDIRLEHIEVLSDAKWLAFIIRQLLTNAIKYSDASDIIIHSYEHKDRIQLEVQDFGRGIDPKDIPRIFEKGFTSTTQHSDHTSTGMGLYLTKKAAQSLLIHIDVHSKPNTGTTFTLIFPKRNDFVSMMSM